MLSLMEKIHGPLNSCIFREEQLSDQKLSEEESRDTLGFYNYQKYLMNTESLSVLEQEEEEEEAEEHLRNGVIPSIEDKMPFLQMLQSVGNPPFSVPFKEPKPNSTGFQFLLRLQHQKRPCLETCSSQIQTLDPESCLTHEAYSPVKDFKMVELEEKNSAEKNFGEENLPVLSQRPQARRNQSCFAVSQPVEKRKRKRTGPPKGKEEVENQRMTHIAVERNRRRLMNDHLNALRSLMPPSYIHRGDQASIIGGAIDYVKELEQLFQSLEAQKRMRRGEEGSNTTTTTSSLQCNEEEEVVVEGECGGGGGGDGRRMMAEIRKSWVAEVQVTAIQNHVNLKIQCERRPGQLLRAIGALEELRLTVLHLNITSLDATVHYSVSVKIEDDCKLGSADEIAVAVHEIFSIINGF